MDIDKQELTCTQLFIWVHVCIWFQGLNLLRGHHFRILVGCRPRALIFWWPREGEPVHDAEGICPRNRVIRYLLGHILWSHLIIFRRCQRNLHQKGMYIVILCNVYSTDPFWYCDLHVTISDMAFRNYHHTSRLWGWFFWGNIRMANLKRNCKV